MTPEAQRAVDLWIARALTSVRSCWRSRSRTAAVFAFGSDRNATADSLALCYSLGLFLAFTTSFWPLPSLRSWTRFERITSCCVLFMVVSYATHLSWELGWLVLRDEIPGPATPPGRTRGGPTSTAATLRYAQPTSTLVSMEILSVLNGLVGTTGLAPLAGAPAAGTAAVSCSAWRRRSSTSTRRRSTTWARSWTALPNVDTSSFLNTWIKFGLANAPWLVFPWLVLYWGQRTLCHRPTRASAGPNETRARRRR